MRRRPVLALSLVLLAAALAGCADSAGSLEMRPVDDAALADEASREVPPPGPFDTRQRAVVLAAVRNGSTTVTYPRPPVERGRPFAYQGRYYDVSYERTGTAEGYVAELRVDLNRSVPANRTVAFEALPAADRRALARELAQLSREGVTEGQSERFPAFYAAGEAGRSVLVPDQAVGAVVYEGRTYPVRVLDTERGTFGTYRYEADLVAANASAYAREVRDRYAVRFRNLSAAERDVLDRAAGDTYRAERGDEAFSSLVGRFLDRPAVADDGFVGNWVLRYGGATYWVRLRYGAFADGDTVTVTSPAVTPPPEE